MFIDILPLAMAIMQMFLSMIGQFFGKFSVNSNDSVAT